MKTINVDLSSGEALNLLVGRQGESGVTQVVFDFSALKTEFGTGTVSLSVKRPKEYTPYAQTITTSGTNATWLVNETDTGVAGCGEIQLTYTVNSQIAKTVVYKYTVYPSIGVDGEYPIPGQTWQQEIEEDIAEIKADLSSYNTRITALEQGGGGSGMSEDFKQALHDILEKLAFIDEDGQDYLDALDDAMWPPAPPVEVSYITAVYTQSGTVYDTDSLNSLKSDLVVTAHYTNGTTGVVTNYTLSGTLTTGTSTITVSYGGKTTTFTVTVTHDVSYVQDGLIHQWDAINNTLNGHSSSTTTWYDLKGLDHLNMNNPSLSTWESNAIVFPGTGGQYLQGSLTPEAIESKTVELCFSPSTVHGAGILIPFRATAKGKLCIYSDNSFCVNGNTGKTYLTGESSLLDLHHIAVTIDSSGNILKAFANGSPATLGSATHSFADTTSYVTVGQPDARSNSSYPFNGRVYAIRMYNRVLSDSEIADNYSVDVTRFELGE